MPFKEGIKEFFNNFKLAGWDIDLSLLQLFPRKGKIMNWKSNILRKEELFGVRARETPLPRISNVVVARFLRQRLRERGFESGALYDRVEAAALGTEKFQPDSMLCRKEMQDEYLIFLPSLSLADVIALFPECFDESWGDVSCTWKEKPIDMGYYVFSRDLGVDEKGAALHPVVWLLNTFFQRHINKVTVENVYSLAPLHVVCRTEGKKFVIFKDHGRYAVEVEDGGWYCDLSTGTPEVRRL